MALCLIRFCRRSCPGVEGLNFQYCGALINYDMPWNPMKVEQRIGRIDRLNQAFNEIRVVNLMYKNTVEADVYQALRERIGLFSNFVGKLQPILSQLPRAFGYMAVQTREKAEEATSELISDIQNRIIEQENAGFDIDEVSSSVLIMPERPRSAYDLSYLTKVLSNPDLLPPGYEAKPIAGGHDFSYSAPGKEPIRVTTDPEYYEEHADSVELWSPGSPAFPHL